MPQKHFMVALKLTKRRKKNSKPHFRQEKNYGMKKRKNSSQISKKKKKKNSSNCNGNWRYLFSRKNVNFTKAHKKRNSWFHEISTFHFSSLLITIQSSYWKLISRNILQVWEWNFAFFTHAVKCAISVDEMRLYSSAPKATYHLNAKKTINIPSAIPIF